MKEYIKENWDGWPLHSLIAVVFIYSLYYYPLETGLVANTALWPDREAAQHDGYANIWTLHRIMEWGCPVVVGFIAYYFLKF